MLKPDASALNRRVAAVGLGVAIAGLSSGKTAAPAAAQATPEAEMLAEFRVVLHAADADRWLYVLSNARSLATDWPEARVRIVVDGNGVIALSGANAIVRELDELTAKGLELNVCPVALREHEIAVDQVPTYADVRYGGVIALVLSVRDGFTYVRP